MNRQKLSTMRYKRVTLWPIARRVDENRGVELEEIDDAWLVADASREKLELRNPRSGQYVELGTDHILEYMTDYGHSDGRLILKCQILLFGRQVPRIVPRSIGPSFVHWPRFPVETAGTRKVRKAAVLRISPSGPKA